MCVCETERQTDSRNRERGRERMVRRGGGDRKDTKSSAAMTDVDEWIRCLRVNFDHMHSEVAKQIDMIWCKFIEIEAVLRDVKSSCSKPIF